MKKSVYYGLLALFIIVFLVSAFFIVRYFLDSYNNQNEYDALAALVASGKDQVQSTVPFVPPVKTEDTESDDPQPQETTASATILPEYAALYLQNDDIVGWITIEGTKVNYPVMQTPDVKDYYLKRNFEKETIKHGSIYARETCDVWTPSDNVTLYGHNMRDGSMFAALLKYKEKSFWEEHRYIIFDTLLEHHTYEIIAVFKTSASGRSSFSYHTFENAQTAEEFDAFVAQCKKLAFYDTGVTAEYGDKLITLSTCEYTLSDGRFVVVAKRIS